MYDLQHRLQLTRDNFNTNFETAENSCTKCSRQEANRWVTGSNTMAVGVFQGVAMDSPKYRSGPPCPISSAPCGPPALKGVVDRRAGGLQPSSTPSDPLSRPPLSKRCCGFAVQSFDRRGCMAWGIQGGSNVVSGVACLQGGRPAGRRPSSTPLDTPRRTSSLLVRNTSANLTSPHLPSPHLPLPLRCGTRARTTPSQH
jgi:hypothetical protein